MRQKVQPELFPDSSHAEVTPDDRASMQGLQKELYQKEQFDQTPQDDSSSRRLKPSNAELGNHSIFHCERATAQFFTHCAYSAYFRPVSTSENPFFSLH